MLMPGFERATLPNRSRRCFLKRWRGCNTFRFMDWMDTNGSRQREWADRPKLEDATWSSKGVPVEVMVELCNRLKVNPWFCMPHQATDDYARQFAALVKRELDPTLRVHVEYSNEVWNGIFEQHRLAEEQARKLGLGPERAPVGRSGAVPCAALDGDLPAFGRRSSAAANGWCG